MPMDGGGPLSTVYSPQGGRGIRQKPTTHPASDLGGVKTFIGNSEGRWIDSAGTRKYKDAAYCGRDAHQCYNAANDTDTAPWFHSFCKESKTQQLQSQIRGDTGEGEHCRAKEPTLVPRKYRSRTFPLHSPTTISDPLSFSLHIAPNLLYSGQQACAPFTHPLSSAANRAAESLSNRLKFLTPATETANPCKLTCRLPNSVTSHHVATGEAEWEAVHLLQEATGSPKMDERGTFTFLDKQRVDLPASPLTPHLRWLHLIPEPVCSWLRDPELHFLANPMLQALDSAASLPGHRVYAITGHFPAIIEKAYTAGVVTWSDPLSETQEYRAMASKITMTSFAVRKDQNHDRMISWPRVQNSYMPQPPHTELPSPDMFSSIRVPDSATLSGFYFDIDNMFHNIMLPSALSRLMPLAPVKASSLSPATLQKIEEDFGRPILLSENLRPLQATLPMGFKWAVYIAHTIAARCMHQAYALFRASNAACGQTSTARMLHLRRSEGLLPLRLGDVLLLHIIDDVNCGTIVR